jgi:hypothetical protein
MKRISDRGKAENIYKSYQKQEKQPLLSANAKTKSGTSKKTAMTMENNTSKSKAAPKKKVKEHDDTSSEDDDGDAENKEQEQGHEMTPVRKRMDAVQVKSSYGPIQEMPTVQERKLEISIDDAIGTLRCVPCVNSNDGLYSASKEKTQERQSLLFFLLRFSRNITCVM